MTTSNILYTEEQIHKKVSECVSWISSIKARHNDLVLCPIMQSSFMFFSDICRELKGDYITDFAGVITHDYDDTLDNVYIYKAPNPNLYNNKAVIVLDTVSYTGNTIKTISKLVQELGARNVYRCALFKSQFCAVQLSWNGFVISDEILYGYGIDKQGLYRNQTFISYA